MIELRWVNVSKTQQRLEYRYQILSVDASGALCPGRGWSDWQVVRSVDLGLLDAAMAGREGEG